MKKLFSFVCALVCAMSLSARDLYLVPNSNWLQSNARFAVYAFENGTKWVDMAIVDGTTNTYKATIDDKYPKVIFCRMNPNTTENKFADGVSWNQTNDLLLSEAGSNNCYTIKEGAWSNGEGSWSFYEETPVTLSYFALHGNFTGKWETIEFTFSEDGATATLTMQLAASSFEFGARIGNSGNWTANGQTITRDKNTTNFKESGSGNNKMTADVAGDYVFTYTVATRVLTVTYPASTGGDPTPDPEPTPDPDPATNDTVFFVNAESWTNIYCYAWTDGSNATWPGVAMKKADYQLQGVDVYFYFAGQGEYANCIFNGILNDSGKQTGNLTWTAGKYYYKGAWKTRAELESDEPIEDVITYGIGSNKNGYHPENDLMTVSDDKTTATRTIELTKDEEFKFSVVVTTNGTSATWLKNTTTTITRENNSAVLAANGEDNNTSMTVDVTGTYTFVFTIGNSTITVTYPSSTPTALSNTEAENSTVKVIRNGQVLIVREGVTYNMMGQVIQ